MLVISVFNLSPGKPGSLLKRREEQSGQTVVTLLTNKHSIACSLTD
ncbi:hypothetical protein ACR78J_21095 [Sphingobacterium spiritivorum]